MQDANIKLFSFSGAKSEALARKVMLMKLKNKSKGPAFIPQSERLYLNITRKGGYSEILCKIFL